MAAQQGAAAPSNGAPKPDAKDVAKDIGSPPEQSELSILWSQVSGFVSQNFLPISFLVALTIALAAPAPGKAAMEPQVAGVRVVAFINTCIVFFISGLALRTAELKGLLSGRGAVATAFGVVSIVGITPLMAWAMRGLPFEPREFATGLAIFAIMPTTLGVGISLVTSAKGNTALAIFLTTVTNIIGVALIPLWLKAAIATGPKAGVRRLTIKFGPIFVKLLLSCLVPTVVGKATRELVPGARDFAQKYRTSLSIFSNLNLAIMIWQTISSAQKLVVSTPFGTMLLLIVAAIVLHVVYLIFNTAVVALLRLPPDIGCAVVLMASQKSAPVAVTTIFYIASSTSTQGLLAVPCVVGQLLQIFMDQPIANYLGQRIIRWKHHQAALPLTATAPAADVTPTAKTADADASGSKAN